MISIVFVVACGGFEPADTASSGDADDKTLMFAVDDTGGGGGGGGGGSHVATPFEGHWVAVSTYVSSTFGTHRMCNELDVAWDNTVTGTNVWSQDGSTTNTYGFPFWGGSLEGFPGGDVAISAYVHVTYAGGEYDYPYFPMYEGVADEFATSIAGTSYLWSCAAAGPGSGGSGACAAVETAVLEKDGIPCVERMP